MKTTFIFLLITLSAVTIYGQTAAWTDYTPKFKADSLGKNGFRRSTVSYDATAKAAIVNGVNMVGWSRSRVENLLGTPTETTGGENKILLEYMIYNNIWTDGGLLTSWITFEVVNGVITSAYISSIH